MYVWRGEAPKPLVECEKDLQTAFIDLDLPMTDHQSEQDREILRPVAAELHQLVVVDIPGPYIRRLPGKQHVV